MSYPNWWSSPNKALQMPDLLAVSDAIAAARPADGATPQLRVVLTTRDAHAIVKSVCEKRNFGREVGGCATEIAMLVLGAAALSAQIAALCRHFPFEDLQRAHPPTVAALGHFLRLADRMPKLARTVNAKAHAAPAASGSRLNPAWRDALVSDLARAQRTLIRACADHRVRRRDAS